MKDLKAHAKKYKKDCNKTKNHLDNQMMGLIFKEKIQSYEFHVK
jgi:hypothetical protein